MSAIPMMTWWLAVPLLAVLITLGVLGALGVGSAMMLKRIANPQLPTKPRSRRRDAKWRRGEDLQRYPERLAALERQLEEAWRAASLQARHLKLKRVELEEKGSRAELVERYEKDLASLRERQESIEGVLATVWRTRSSLLLRVHLAVAARQRPELDHLPDPADVTPKYLESAALAYAQASGRVREYVEVLAEHRRLARDVVPTPAGCATVDEEDRLAVEDELLRVQATFERVRGEMDELSDNLSYLADRLRTQQLFELGEDFKVDPDSTHLLDELSSALEQLDELSALGDQRLADLAVQDLAADLTSLEMAGLEIDAEAEASREVERLLASFTRIG